MEAREQVSKTSSTWGAEDRSLSWISIPSNLAECIYKEDKDSRRSLTNWYMLTTTTAHVLCLLAALKDKPICYFVRDRREPHSFQLSLEPWRIQYCRCLGRSCSYCNDCFFDFLWQNGLLDWHATDGDGDVHHRTGLDPPRSKKMKIVQTGWQVDWWDSLFRCEQNCHARTGISMENLMQILCKSAYWWKREKT